MTSKYGQQVSAARKPADPSSDSGVFDTASISPDTQNENWGGPLQPAGQTPVPPQPPQASIGDWVGKSLGKYDITGVLGEGGMGVVLKARDRMIDRDVAIKVLAGHLASNTSALDRLLAEARAAGKLNHPNVTAIYEIGQEGGTYYLVLEFVPGGCLGQRLQRPEPISVVEATEVLIDACKGVGAAHAAGLIHRDIKPANFLRAAHGATKVADFGIAKAVANDGRQVTHSGQLIGTPWYMSPEQCEGKPLDHRTDLYSLGATYYTLLTGKTPYYETRGMIRVMYSHCEGPVPDPRSVNPAIPAACSRIVARAMAKAPADRYQSTGEMLIDLQGALKDLSAEMPAGGWGGWPQAASVKAPVSERRVSTPPLVARRPRHGLRRPWGPASLLPAAILLLVVLGTLPILLWRPWEKLRQGRPGVPAAVPPGSDPVKIGVLQSLSGTMANSEAVLVDAVMFALDEVNQAGGVLGRPVIPVVVDGRSDWPTFAREAERLISQEQVCTVFGCWTSASRKTVRPVFEAHNHLLIYPVQYEGLESSPSIVYMGASPNQQILPALQWALGALHKKRFFLVGSDYVFPRAAHAIVKDQLERAGAQIAGEAYVPLGSQSVETVVSAITQAKPDMILGSRHQVYSNAHTFLQCRRAGIAESATDGRGRRLCRLDVLPGDRHGGEQRVPRSISRQTSAAQRHRSDGNGLYRREAVGSGGGRSTKHRAKENKTGALASTLERTGRPGLD
jgi:urea transport system substrate-binding protein